MPIRSMTAYASSETTTPWGVLAIELRSVNHRFLEIATRLPDELRALEPMLRERIAARVQRGKLDVGMRLRAADGAGGGLQVDRERLAELARLSRELEAEFPHLRTEFSQLLQVPGVVRGQGVDTAALHALALQAVDAVLGDFVVAREREGAKLAQAISERIEAMAGLAVQARALVPQIREGQRTRLLSRLAELAHPVEPARIEQEIVLALQKLDVDEELDRLEAHIGEARRVLGLREAVGRRLDFLLQEFNREANTLGSKSVDTRTSNVAIELKVLIDQVREQVQNIE